GDTTATATAGMLTLLSGGAAIAIRRRRKQGKS
ncbi:LPXTG cell wall anchor domain-containing protein, partial [Thomasclavelia ramosa]